MSLLPAQLTQAINHNIAPCLSSPWAKAPSSSRIYSGWYDGDSDDRSDSRDSDGPSSYRGRGSRGDSYGRRDRDSYGGGGSSYSRGRGSSRGGRSSYGGRGQYGSERRAPREPREGDWDCPACGANNFAGRTSCFKCEETAPEEVLATASQYRSERREYREPREPREAQPGDWDCPACGANNFAGRTSCFKCRETAPEEVLATASQYRPQQREYREPREPREAQPGDWDCPECGANNFARRTRCFKCGESAPEEVLAARGYEDRDRGYGRGGERDYAPRERRDYGRGGDRDYAPRERREYVQREYVAREGDWTCQECGDVNYAFRTECRKCNAPKA
jgi:hypothetical protein